MLLPQGLCSYCSLCLGYLLPRIHITSSELPYCFQEHCSNVSWWKKLIFFDPKALSKTVFLPSILSSYHSLSYLHTLLFFFLNSTYLHLMNPVCLPTVCLLSRAGPLSVLFTVVPLVPGSAQAFKKKKNTKNWVWWKNMDGLMMLKGTSKQSPPFRPEI